MKATRGQANPQSVNDCLRSCSPELTSGLGTEVLGVRRLAAAFRRPQPYCRNNRFFILRPSD